MYGQPAPQLNEEQLARAEALDRARSALMTYEPAPFPVEGAPDGVVATAREISAIDLVEVAEYIVTGQYVYLKGSTEEES